MGLLGGGAVAIWHDIAAEGRDEFYAWHGREHMPERVSIPGFRRGRRYVAVDADLEFFNLYETDTPAVLTAEDYKARLNAPTEWTQRTVKHFRNVARSLCWVVHSTGHAQGGLAATLRYDVPDDDRAPHRAAMRKLFETALSSHSIAAAHLLMADAEASTEMNAEEKARGRRNEVPGCVVLVEGWGDTGAFTDVCRSILSPDVLKAAGALNPPDFGIYQLQATVAETDI